MNPMSAGDGCGGDCERLFRDGGGGDGGLGILNFGEDGREGEGKWAWEGGWWRRG